VYHDVYAMYHDSGHITSESSNITLQLILQVVGMYASLVTLQWGHVFLSFWSLKNNMNLFLHLKVVHTGQYYHNIHRYLVVLPST